MCWHTAAIGAIGDHLLVAIDPLAAIQRHWVFRSAISRGGRCVVAQDSDYRGRLRDRLASLLSRRGRGYLLDCFVLTPGFCPYYLIWLAPFILVLSPSFYGWLTATSSLFLFFFYNGLAGGLPWFIGVSKFSDPNRFNLLTPWSLWPRSILIAGTIALWRKTARVNPAFRFFTFETLLPERT